jgi:Mor family transcriptional regulator
MEYLKDIAVEELSADQQEIIRLIGLEAFGKLVEHKGGMLIYIPKRDVFMRTARNDAIRREFNGTNYRDLAVKYNLTEVSIRMIVADIDEKMRKAPIEGQETLF